MHEVLTLFLKVQEGVAHHQPGWIWLRLPRMFCSVGLVGLFLWIELCFCIFVNAWRVGAAVGATVCSFGQRDNLRETVSQELPVCSADNALVRNQLTPVQGIECLDVLADCVEQNLDILDQVKSSLSRVVLLLSLVASPVWQTQSLSSVNGD